MLRLVLSYVWSRVGLTIIAAAIVAAIGGYAVWRHQVSTSAVTEFKQQQTDIQVGKVKRAAHAQETVRRRLTGHPDRLRNDNDGYRRD